MLATAMPARLNAGPVGRTFSSFAAGAASLSPLGELFSTHLGTVNIASRLVINDTDGVAIDQTFGPLPPGQAFRVTVDRRQSDHPSKPAQPDHPENSCSHLEFGFHST